MALIALVARDGMCRAYTGSQVLTFPGVVVREDGLEEWTAGRDIFTVQGLRFRVEDVDALAYWAVLTEAIIELRAPGAVDVVIGLGEEEYGRIGEEIGSLVSKKCGGRAVIRHGDHYALYSQEPWRSGEAPDQSEQTVLIRVGAHVVQAFCFAGKKVAGRTTLEPGWENAVVYLLGRKAFEEGERKDVHELTWNSTQSESDEATNYATFLLSQMASLRWTGKLMVSGIGSEPLQKAMAASISAVAPSLKLAGSLADEAVGLWSYARQKGLGQ